MSIIPKGNIITDDKDLIGRIAAGDKRAFKTFIERYQRLVSHIVFRMVDNTADREDAAQEIFIKAYKDLNNFKYESTLATWVGRIAFNTCVNHLKKRKMPLFDDMVTGDETADSAVFMEPDKVQNSSPEQLTEQQDISVRIESAVNRLPSQYRTIITLYHNDEMSYERIGEIMGLPEGTVKSYLFRARKLLKAIFMNQYQREDIYR